jgi:hypothetical protein
VLAAALELHADVAVHRRRRNIQIFDRQTRTGKRASSRRTPDEADQTGQSRRHNGAQRHPAQPPRFGTSVPLNELHNGNQPTFLCRFGHPQAMSSLVLA